MVVAGPYQSRFECDLNAPCRFTLQDQGVNLWPGDLIRSGVSGCAAPDASGELREDLSVTLYENASAEAWSSPGPAVRDLCWCQGDCEGFFRFGELELVCPAPFRTSASGNECVCADGSAGRETEAECPGQG